MGKLYWGTGDITYEYKYAEFSLCDGNKKMAIDPAQWIIRRIQRQEF